MKGASSDYGADLTILKGKREGRRTQEEGPWTEAQFQERFCKATGNTPAKFTCWSSPALC